MTLFADDPILPAPPDGLEPLHDREYRVRAYRLAADRILIQGAVRDQKPPGLYISHDPDPLTIHHMQVSLTISFPFLEIVDAKVDFESHPHSTCPAIIDHYGQLVGLSIARGYTHKVRELFGGPRGCTHTTALLQAMAPVAMQCFWSMKAADAKLRGEESPIGRSDDTDGSFERIVGTCHVWAEDGDAIAARRAGDPHEVPLFLRPRLRQLGLADQVPEGVTPPS